MRTHPALDVRGADPDLVLAAVDGFGPLAGEERESALRVFFGSQAERNAAREALRTEGIAAEAVDVPDDDWARRSQAGLQPVEIGRITVVPGPAFALAPPRARAAWVPSSGEPRPAAESILIVIPPSTGFGTGHHATTRLCLAALQTLDLTGALVLDVGTGSGVLAIAAARLGARAALGIDSDADAVECARENRSLNQVEACVAFEVADLTSYALPPARVVTANLTGALLIRASSILSDALEPGGSLILGGLLAHERPAVAAAFDRLAVVHEAEEDGWVGLVMKRA